jgi:electron transfer flavoprotein alpha subunit
MNRILVVSEQSKGDNLEISYEMLGKANELAASSGAQVYTVCFCQEENCLEKLAKYGAKKIIACQCDKNKSYVYYSKILEKIVEKYQFEMVLFASTVLGKKMSSVLATSIGAGLVADCINVSIDEERKYIFARAAMSSSIIAKIVCDSDCVQICTVKKNVFKECIKKVETVSYDIEMYKAELEDPFAGFIKVLSMEGNDNKHKFNIENSNLIFSVGRGVEKNDIDKVRKLAEYYHADFAGTRPMTESGIIAREQQVGQSGVAVKPKVYVAFGISGASQHVVGIGSSTIVIAINNDENANIFQYADYKIVADTHQVIEKLCKNIER